MKLQKTMIGGKWLKVNGKHIESIGYFAYDGCHKIYVLESNKDLKYAMELGYRLYPIMEIDKTYNESCPLKFIENMSLTKYYVRQAQKARWSYAKVTKKEMEEWEKVHSVCSL